jgi:hypothetical protein
VFKLFYGSASVDKIAASTRLCLKGNDAQNNEALLHKI